VLFDLVADDALVLLLEPRRMRDRAADLLHEEADLAASLALTWGAATAKGEEGFPRLHLPFDRLLTHTSAAAWTLTTAPEGPDVATVASMGIAAAAGDPERVVRQLAGLAADGYQIVVAADGEGSAARLRTLLAEHGLSPSMAGTPAAAKAQVVIDVTPLERGCILPAVKLAVIAEHDLTGRRRAHRAARARRRDSQGFFDDLKAGDHVVHHQHGVARYAGMVKRAIGGVERDYLLLEYKGDDKLYVPSDQIDAVRHYTGGEAPTLSRLGGDGWQKAKAKVRSAVSEIAQELVVLYQKRLHEPGHAFPPDTPWQRELEDAFPYQETPDQLTAIAEVKGDMEEGHPMDRLVCGDVGFGKTEVAIRAAFKAVQDGKQVAVLVPTTLLAQQHHQTFADRFAGYPVRVEVLSRFLTPGQAREVAKGLRGGEVDVVIGTHRLLSDDIEFKDLGLLVVDEEQRFGVTHKEQIKQLKSGVDVLTLSATPIPRTLEMSLTGIRDLTLLNTPPADRMPIMTYVGEYDDRAVGEAIRRELLREGQVFYVHNRVQDIEQVAEHVRELVPEARVAIAHGQMDEGTLEQVVLAFWEGDYDVLVCTTIIESGIDMPTVNTLVVDRADLLGLGQLHQLRGRVGRSGQRAYAYLFVPQDRVLSEEAYERLKTIGEATELGSGFKIAMRDLEIRGAGNLLGTGQSGHIAAVGYDLYCQMVSEAVAELKGEPVREPAEIKLDLPLPANLPREYVQKEELRLEAYRRLAAVTTDDEVLDIRTEWEDRYGPLPEPAEALLAVARLRAEASRTGVREVVVVKPSGFGGSPSTARLTPLPLKTSQQIRLKRLHPTAVYKEAEQLLIVKIPHKEHPADWLVALLRDLDPVTEPEAA
jgi:transcription-repair coupling factor (superfamily II helicase)